MNELALLEPAPVIPEEKPKRFVVHYFCRGECIDHQIVDFVDDGLIWAACIQNRCDGMMYLYEEIN
jgi:hypothetical protein